MNQESVIQHHPYFPFNLSQLTLSLIHFPKLQHESHTLEFKCMLSYNSTPLKSTAV